MTPKQLRTHVTTVPFVPFRVHISNGSAYLVHNPDWIMLTPRYTSLGVVDEAGGEPVIVTIDNLHITHVEAVPATPT